MEKGSGITVCAFALMDNGAYSESKKTLITSICKIVFCRPVRKTKPVIPRSSPRHSPKKDEPRLDASKSRLIKNGLAPRLIGIGVILKGCPKV